MAMAEDRFTAQRQRMVTEQIEGRFIRNRRVLDAMLEVPRHLFVPPEDWDLAYADRPIHIGQNQTISQPYIVALMTELLHLTGEEIVLEIGTGSGYQAAILGKLVKQVYTIERHESLAARAAEVIRELGIDNVTVKCGDGSVGWEEHSPYDGILVTAAAPEVPQALLDQLADGGRMILPVGGPRGQSLQVWQREGPKYTHEAIVPVSFVPLRGEHGWKSDWEDFFSL